MDAEKKEAFAFAKNTIVNREGERWQIDCKKGFWSVNAPTLSEASREAEHYFRQYYFDGDYN